MLKLRSNEKIIIRRILIIIGFFVIIMIFRSVPFTHLYNIRVIIDKGVVQRSSCMQKTRIEYYNKSYHTYKYGLCRAEVLWEKSGLKIANYAIPVLGGDCLVKYEVQTYEVSIKDNSPDITEMIPFNISATEGMVDYCSKLRVSKE